MSEIVEAPIIHGKISVSTCSVSSELFIGTADESNPAFRIQYDSANDNIIIDSQMPITTPSLEYNGTVRTLDTSSYITKGDIDTILNAALPSLEYTGTTRTLTDNSYVTRGDIHNLLQSGTSGDASITTDSYSTAGLQRPFSSGGAYQLNNNLLSELSAKQPLIQASNRLNADLIHDGSVSNAEFGYLNGVNDNIQTQLNAKVTSTETHTYTDGDFNKITQFVDNDSSKHNPYILIERDRTNDGGGLRSAELTHNKLEFKSESNNNETEFEMFFDGGVMKFSGSLLLNNATVTTSSDDRLKHNEVDIVGALAVIAQLQPQTYDMGRMLLDADHTGEVEESTRMSGFIAQDVAQIPSLAHTVRGEATSDTPMQLDYTSIFTHAVAAIQELSAQVTALTARVAALE